MMEVPVAEEKSGIDWQTVAESERSCINCGHSRSAHWPDAPNACGWRYFSFIRKCRCKSYDGGNIWPRLVIPPGGTVEIIVGLVTTKEQAGA